MNLFENPKFLLAAFATSATLNCVFIGALLAPDPEVGPTPALSTYATTPQPEPVAQPEIVEPVEDPSIAEAPAPALAKPTEVAPPTEAALPSNAKADDALKSVRVPINISIPHTLAEPAAPYGDNVSATVSRLLVWDLDLRKDLRAGDILQASWSMGTSDVVVIEAARLESQKLGKAISAYRFKATGDKYPSYWSEDGTEIPHILKKSPLKEYEQITSLLKDRPTHHGMDFKVDVGTPIYSGFDGVVTRVNWNTAANGGCVEVEHSDGVLAKYLHLSESKVKPGTRVKAGDLIALSGNTGRSTGPHLHYQLNKGSKVIDPIDYHGTTRRTLPESDRAAFAATVQKFQ